MLFRSTDSASTSYINKRIAGTRTTISSDTSLAFSTNTWYNVKLRVSNQNWYLFVDGNAVGSGLITDSSLYGVENVGLIFRAFSVSFLMQADNFRLRPYTSSIPTYTIGAEQEIGRASCRERV